MKLLDIFLALLLPPFSIFLAEGFGVTLIINIALTLTFWLPGSIHAVWVLSKRAERAI